MAASIRPRVSAEPAQTRGPTRLWHRVGRPETRLRNRRSDIRNTRSRPPPVGRIMLQAWRLHPTNRSFPRHCRTSWRRSSPSSRSRTGPDPSSSASAFRMKLQDEPAAPGLAEHAPVRGVRPGLVASKPMRTCCPALSQPRGSGACPDSLTPLNHSRACAAGATSLSRAGRVSLNTLPALRRCQEGAIRGFRPRRPAPGESRRPPGTPPRPACEDFP